MKHPQMVNLTDPIRQRVLSHCGQLAIDHGGVIAVELSEDEATAFRGERPAGTIAAIAVGIVNDHLCYAVRDYRPNAPVDWDKARRFAVLSAQEGLEAQLARDAAIFADAAGSA